ncbi:hypothetical protein L083_3449 [Actinoplanes sp. N902-109]|nr:hypothetical protein L083_3449 [Actinoplanes sp. N902-109]
MYRGGRPNRLARALNTLSAAQFARGVLAPERAVTLEVRGRTTGRPVALPLVVADVSGEHYLVSMLGEANWVRNVRAAGGIATLRHGRSRRVRLLEVPPGERAAVLRRYLALAPGARPHFPIGPDAPLADFAAIADHYPVFRITDAGPA